MTHSSAEVFMSSSHVSLSPNAALEWKDGKRYLWLLGLVVPVFPFLSGALVAVTGSEWGWWFGPLVLYTVIPLMDRLIGGDRFNPPEEVVDALSKEKYYRYCVYAFVPLHYLGLIWAMYLLTSGSMGWVGSIGLVATIGIVSGVAFNTAHELGHQNSAFEMWMSKIALAPTFYGHFVVEHNRGHHVRVATPEDPASARYGESYWAFLPRTMAGGLKSAWSIERKRLARSNKSVWHWQNHNLQAWGLSVLLYAGLIAAFGWAVLPFVLAQSIYSMTLFEVINYLEHYGLCRQKNASGRYERCQPEHSWNSNHLVTNLLLYQLQRHSDHHANPTRSYQALRHFEDVPQLPSGYAGMVPLAYITPLWRRVMDAKVRAHYGGDLSLANIDPRLKKQGIGVLKSE
jgi:alkane 1-monooxygenase|tara:strand:- start:48013 stop:49212 length:1200 start_codon:yes stop_codon:yes gene_type:complete